MKRRRFLGFCATVPFVGQLVFNTVVDARPTVLPTTIPKMKGRRELQIELYITKCQQIIDKFSNRPDSRVTIVQANGFMGIDQKIDMVGCRYVPKLPAGLVLTEQELDSISNNLSMYAIDKFREVYHFNMNKNLFMDLSAIHRRNQFISKTRIV